MTNRGQHDNLVLLGLRHVAHVWRLRGIYGFRYQPRRVDAGTRKGARMRRFLYSALALATLLVLALPSAASARVEYRHTLPFEGGEFVSCALGGAGEEVLLSGERLLISGTTTDAQGVDHGFLHAGGGAAHGIGLTSGDRYVSSFVSHSVHRFTYDPEGQSVYVETLNLQVVGQGPGNNFRWQLRFHVVTDANGNLSVYRYEDEIFCR